MVGQLCGNMYFFAAVIFREYRAERFFAARINIGRIEIIDAHFDRMQNFTLDLLHVKAVAALREAHASETEYG